MTNRGRLRRRLGGYDPGAFTPEDEKIMRGVRPVQDRHRTLHLIRAARLHPDLLKDQVTVFRNHDPAIEHTFLRRPI